MHSICQLTESRVQIYIHYQKYRDLHSSITVQPIIQVLYMVLSGYNKLISKDYLDNILAIFRVKFKLTFTLDSRNSLYFFIFMFYFLCVLLSCVLILSLVHFLLIHLKPFESDVVFERTLGDIAETLDTKRHANRHIQHDAAHYLPRWDIMETPLKLKKALATKSLAYVNFGQCSRISLVHAASRNLGFYIQDYTTLQ